MLLTNIMNTTSPTINIKFTDNAIKGDYKAISYFDESKSIIIPTNLSNNCPFIYDFENKIKLNDVNVEYGSIKPGKITDATNVDMDNCFWLLSVDYDDNTEQNKGFLIKAFYNYYNNKIVLINQYEVPNVFMKYSNFEAIVRVSSNNFILFSNSNDYSARTIFVYIKNHIVNAQLLNFELNWLGTSVKKLTNDLGKITGAFNFEDGIIVFPQLNTAYAYPIYKISNQEIAQIKKEIKSKIEKQQYTILTQASVDLIGIQNNILTVKANVLFSYYVGDISNGFLSNVGVEAMTANKYNKIFGISTWIYPYFVLKGEKAPDGQQFVNVLDSETFPDGYDRSKAGVYTKPVVGVN